MQLLRKYIFGIGLSFILSFQASADCSYELFTVTSAKGTKIIDFIDQLSDQCEFSLIITDINAQKYLESELNKIYLKNLTINEVLDIILLENNLSYKLENNLLKISYLTTRIFSIDYLLSQRKATAKTEITLSSSSAGGGGTTTSTGATGSGAMTESGMQVEATDEVIFWKDLDLEFQRILNRPEDSYKAELPIINKNGGLITVTATTKQMSRFANYLKRLQDKVQLQVLIDVQLLSVTMSEGKTTGVDWEQLYALQNITIKFGGGAGTKTNEDGSTFDPSNYVTIEGGGTLKEVIKFLQTQGEVNSISNPKILTLNNQPALITVGTEYFYKIKQETNQQGSSGGIAATTQNDMIQSVFAGVLLDITPEIADDNTIILKINPSLSETREDISKESNEDRTMPPDLHRRQLSTVVTIKDGNRIILGGLINTKSIRNSNKIPILGDIPGLSSLFKYEANTKQVEELVIIIETHIIRKSNNKLSLSKLGYEGISDDILKITDTNNNEPSNELDDLEEVQVEDGI